MKKFIAISTSAILLSLLGVSGLNQNSLDFMNTANTKYNTTSIEQNVTNTGEQNLLSNNKTDTEVKGATVKTASKKGQSLVYKNINLSNCKNVSEVVKKLQANGCKNITMANVKDIPSLKNIISKLENKESNKSDKPATKPTTTTKPSTTTKPTTTTKPETTTNDSSYANQVLQLVNQERAKAGLSALTTNATLTSAANVRAKETVQSFSHTRPNGTSFSTVLKEFNISYRAAGENIAYGQKTPQEVVTGWMNSPGHRANILNANFGKIGIGVHKASNGTIYWSQLFTN